MLKRAAEVKIKITSPPQLSHWDFSHILKLLFKRVAVNDNSQNYNLMQDKNININNITCSNAVMKSTRNSKSFITKHELQNRKFPRNTPR